MDAGDGPTVMLLDGDFDNSLQIAKELSVDLRARIVGVGTSRFSRLLHSRYCDAGRIAPAKDHDDYPSAVLSLLREVRPDVVLPVGYRSVAALSDVRSRIPDGVVHSLPPRESLEVAVDKRKTVALAERCGIDVPADYTDRFAALGATPGEVEGLENLPFPLFLKARRESGQSLSAVVDSPEGFWGAYERLHRRAAGGDVLVQEYLPGDGRTYASGVVHVDGSLRYRYGHEEVRSVPRHGGSGTRLRTFSDGDLHARTARLMDELDWNGVALVEYRRTDDGYVLMEINPKFWASYALASQCGHRFASTYVSEHLGLPFSPDSRRSASCERVFPLRELNYAFRNYGEESLVEAARAMLWPPSRPASNLEDLPAWILPPADVVRRARGGAGGHATGETGRGACETGHGAGQTGRGAGETRATPGRGADRAAGPVKAAAATSDPPPGDYGAGPSGR